jgi:hypothetical protein
MRQRRREATTNDSNLSKVHRCEGYFASVQIKPVIFTLFRCKFTELPFSYCDSAAALRATAWAQRSNTCDAQRASPRVTVWSARSSACGDNERRLGQQPGHQNQVPSMRNERRRGQLPEPIPGITGMLLHHETTYYHGLVFRRNLNYL